MATNATDHVSKHTNQPFRKGNIMSQTVATLTYLPATNTRGTRVRIMTRSKTMGGKAVRVVRPFDHGAEGHHGISDNDLCTVLSDMLTDDEIKNTVTDVQWSAGPDKDTNYLIATYTMEWLPTGN